MAVKLKVDDVYTEIKQGVGSKGRWGFATARAEKGYDRITVWFANPDDIPEGAYAVKVDEITEVGTENKQVNGKWYTQYYIRAKVSTVEGGAVPTEIEDIGVPF